MSFLSTSFIHWIYNPPFITPSTISELVNSLWLIYSSFAFSLSQMSLFITLGCFLYNHWHKDNTGYYIDLHGRRCLRPRGKDTLDRTPSSWRRFHVACRSSLRPWHFFFSLSCYYYLEAWFFFRAGRGKKHWKDKIRGVEYAENPKFVCTRETVTTHSAEGIGLATHTPAIGWDTGLMYRGTVPFFFLLFRMERILGQ